MIKSNANTVISKSASASTGVRSARRSTEPHAAYIGMDVHKDTLTYAVALPGRAAGQYRGEIAHSKKAVNKLMQRLSDEFTGELLLFCYEAGPTGYPLYRQIMASGHDCQVVLQEYVDAMKATNASEEAREIAWRAQKRLCGRYRRLVESGKNQKVVCVAIARELIGFIWDIVCIEMSRLPARQANR